MGQTKFSSHVRFRFSSGSIVPCQREEVSYTVSFPIFITSSHQSLCPWHLLIFLGTLSFIELKFWLAFVGSGICGDLYSLLCYSRRSESVEIGIWGLLWQSHPSLFPLNLNSHKQQQAKRRSSRENYKAFRHQFTMTNQPP